MSHKNSSHAGRKAIADEGLSYAASTTPFGYHHRQPHDALDNNYLRYVHQHETTHVQHEFEQDYHQTVPRHQPRQRRGSQRSRGSRGEIAGIPPGHLHNFPVALRDTRVAERSRAVAVACDYCKGRHKTVSFYERLFFSPGFTKLSLVLWWISMRPMLTQGSRAAKWTLCAEF